VKRRHFQIKLLIQLQRVSWRLVLVCFLLATVLYALQLPIASSIAFWSVIALLAVILTTILFLAEQFHTARLYRYWLLSYALIFILLSTILLKVYFTP